jgi:catechol 2,3-dioxygenase-like lactoylglutathione lyase family enzyme
VAGISAGSELFDENRGVCWEGRLSIAKVTGLSYVAFGAPDLGKMQEFLEDFGMRVVESHADVLFMGGYGPEPFLHKTVRGEPGFSALGLTVASIDDVMSLSKATGVAMSSVDMPGGGGALRLQDPDGFVIEIIGGQSFEASRPAPPVRSWNCQGHTVRGSTPKALRTGSAHVARLGHCVLRVANFRKSERWYKSLFGFLTSDEVQDDSGEAMGAFLRCDCGDQPTDHHTLFLAQSTKPPAFRHAAFEVEDFDDLMVGHDFLSQRGHRPAWGVGRHVLGSQIFDYWCDPWGNVLEHWTDGDLLTCRDGSRNVPIAQLHGVYWGPAFSGI